MEPPQSLDEFAFVPPLRQVSLPALAPLNTEKGNVPAAPAPAAPASARAVVDKESMPITDAKAVGTRWVGTTTRILAKPRSKLMH